MSSFKKDRSIPPGVLDENRRTIINKHTGEQIKWEKYGFETNGASAVATIVCLPGGGPPLHYHTTYTERFEAVDGDLGIVLGNDEPRHLSPGESATVPVGVTHRFFNDGDRPVVSKGHVIPAHAGFERSLYILFGLNNDGLADPSSGMPKSILHTALVADMGDMRFPGFTGGVVNLLTKALATWARWLGVEEDLLQRYWD